MSREKGERMPAMIPLSYKFSEPSQAWISQSEIGREDARSVSFIGGDAMVEPNGAGQEPCLGKEFVGRSKGMREVFQQIELVAPTDATVLILGETGTGKELVARAIHDMSGRSQRILSRINCAAIPSGLLESELFGHEKGSFTGAISRRTGRFELADRGSLFLDEIGDFPADLQPKLLRVLQEREFERVGSNQTQKCNVRLIAGTSRNLQQMVADQQFRSDLFYRLNVFPIRIPPLRDRPSDIPLLVRHFVDQFASKMNKVIEIVSQDVMDALTTYRWPGNIRELQNFIERAVILSPGETLNAPLRELELALTFKAGAAQSADGKTRTLRDHERGYIIQVLTETRWRVGGPNGAAARLGINRSTLVSRMQKLGISRMPKP